MRRSSLILAGCVFGALVVPQVAQWRQQAHTTVLLARVVESLDLLRAQLADHMRAAPPSPASGSPEPDQNRRAFEAARRLVDQALSSREWGDPQAEALQQLRVRLTAAQVESLLADLIPAVNSQKVRLLVSGPAF